MDSARAAGLACAPMARPSPIGWLLALALAPGCPGDPAEPARAGSGSRGVVFRRRVPQPGTVIVARRHQRSRLELSQRRGGKRMTVVQGTDQRVETRTTVLVATDAAVTRKRVEYVGGASEQRIGDRVQRVPNPLLGKTYVLEARDAGLHVGGSDGAPVSDYERELLEREHGNLGRPSAFAALLPRRPVAPGERLRPDPETLARAFGQAGVQVRDASFVLQSLGEQDGRRLGTFRVAVTLVEEDEQTHRETRLGGRVVLRVDTCWPVAVELSGPIEIEGRSPDPSDLHGRGEVSLQVSTQYESNGG